MLADKRILMVTTLNLSSNPRCLKEIGALLSQGVKVTVLKFNFDNWSNNNETEIEKKLPTVNWIKINATRKPFIKWFTSTVINKFSARLSVSYPANVRFQAYSLDKRSILLHSALKSIKPVYDFIIAHNPGAFWPVSNYAISNHIPFGIDIEDYHPGEYKDEAYTKNMLLMMAGTLSKASYITAASPLILEYTRKNVPVIKAPAVTINNVFPLEKQPQFRELEINSDTPLKLFWFSQHLGMDRGLQDIIAAMNIISEFTIQLTFMGNCSVSVKQQLQELLTNDKHTIIFKEAGSEVELINESSKHHIGLGLENATNLNRNICLTNKIFTYLLAGNALVLSDTDAQMQFLKQYPTVGYSYNQGEPTALADVLTSLFYETDKINKSRKAAYSLANDKLNWDVEQEYFVNLLSQTLA